MSDVCAVASLVTTTTSPAIASVLVQQVAVEGRGDGARPHVVVVGRVALAGRHAEQLEVAGHVHRPVGAQRAGEDPHEREVADVGVGLGVHDLGDERAVRVGADLDRGATPDRGDRRQRVQAGVREGGLDDVQQHPDAGAGLGRQRAAPGGRCRARPP